MAVITVYHVFCERSLFSWERTEYYSLTPWEGDTNGYCGYDDGGCAYFLPNQLLLGTDLPAHCDSPRTVPRIFTASKRAPCRLCSGTNGPVVILPDGSVIQLQKNNLTRMFTVD